MVWTGFIPRPGEFSPGALVILLAVAVVAFLVQWRARKSSRPRTPADDAAQPAAFDPDQGGTGITLLGPAVPSRPVADPPRSEALGERWLLGFAAPHLQRASREAAAAGETWGSALDWRAWSLTRDPYAAPRGAVARTGEQDDVASGPGAAVMRDRARQWLRDERTRLAGAPLLAARREMAAGQDAARASALALVAWGFRLDVAAGVMSASEASDRTLDAVRQANLNARDWLSFGDLLIAGGADPDTVRSLYRPGAAWETPAWPAD